MKLTNLLKSIIDEMTCTGTGAGVQPGGGEQFATNAWVGGRKKKKKKTKIKQLK